MADIQTLRVQNRITMTSTEGREPSGLAVVESFARPR